MASRLALGCWAYGGGFGFWEDQERGDSLKTLHLAIRSGITEYDTAASYGNGRGEQILGQQLKRFSLPRESLFLSTKTMGNDSLETSLRRLCTDSIDLWYLHWPNSRKDCHTILEKMAKEPKAKAIGICNVTVPYLRNLEDLPISWVQVPCNLIWTRGMKELIHYAKEKGIRLSGYSPMGMGVLSGRHDTPPNDSRKELYCYRHMKEFNALLSALDEMATAHDSTPGVVALAWAFSQGFDQIVLGARKKEQLQEDLKATTILLTADESEELDDLSCSLQECADKEQDNLFSHRW